MNSTIDYYNKNARVFVEHTIHADMRVNQERFLAKLAQNASILDFGCGSGRDTGYFLDRGFQVTAIDGSEELCRLAGEYTGIPVRHMLFQELEETEIYDGIWACASVLHLPMEELKEVLGSWKRFFPTGSNWKDLGKGFFVEKEGYVLALREEMAEVIGKKAFREHMGDILEYRTMEYYRRRYAEGRSEIQ